MLYLEYRVLGLKYVSCATSQVHRPLYTSSQYFVILNSFDDHTPFYCHKSACGFFVSYFYFFSVDLCWAFLVIVFCPCGSLLALSLSTLVQFEDSEEDFDSRFDTDDELSYRRDSVYSCVTLPYFHSFLYMKGMTCVCPGAWVRGEAMGN